MQDIKSAMNYIFFYSPNFNLIERLLKFVKSELRDEFYDSFNRTARIDAIIASTSETNKSKINTLIDSSVQMHYLYRIAENTYEGVK